MKFAIKFVDITHLTLGMLLHYLGKLKIEIFWKYSVDMEKRKQIAFLSILTVHPQISIF